MRAVIVAGVVALVVLLVIGRVAVAFHRALEVVRNAPGGDDES